MPNSPKYPECRHILPSGSQCHSPALKGQPLCYYHSRTRTLVDCNRYRQRSLALPPLEDRGAIQISLNEVFSALAASKIDRRTAGLYLFGLQIASQNLGRNPNLASTEAVDLCHEQNGEVLAGEAPEASSSDDPFPPMEKLHLEHINECDTHEYEREAPDNRPPSKKVQAKLDRIEEELKLHLIAVPFYERAREEQEARNKAANPESLPPPPSEEV